MNVGGPAVMTCIEGKGWTSSSMPYCVPSCGKPVHKSRSHWLSRARLFGGDATVPHSWPWQVAIEVYSIFLRFYINPDTSSFFLNCFLIFNAIECFNFLYHNMHILLVFSMFSLHIEFF